MNNIQNILPQELQLKILSYLSPKELAAATLVSKHFNTLAKDESLWKQHFLRDYPCKDLTDFSYENYQNYTRHFFDIIKEQGRPILETLIKIKEIQNDISSGFSIYKKLFQNTGLTENNRRELKRLKDTYGVSDQDFKSIDFHQPMLAQQSKIKEDFVEPSIPDLPAILNIAFNGTLNHMEESPVFKAGEGIDHFRYKLTDQTLWKFHEEDGKNWILKRIAGSEKILAITHFPEIKGNDFSAVYWACRIIPSTPLAETFWSEDIVSLNAGVKFIHSEALTVIKKYLEIKRPTLPL